MASLETLFDTHPAAGIACLVLAAYCGLVWIVSAAGCDSDGRSRIDPILIQESGYYLITSAVLVAAIFQTILSFSIGALLFVTGLSPILTKDVVLLTATLVQGVRRYRYRRQ